MPSAPSRSCSADLALTSRPGHDPVAVWSRARARAPAGHGTGVTTSLTGSRCLSAGPVLNRPRSSPALRQAARFLIVGGAATALDVGLFNVLHYGLGVGPLTSKICSTVLAAAAAFAGNRQWSFHGAQAGRMRRQAATFLLVNAAALLLTLLPLAAARYVFGLTGVVALNVAGNGVGLALGTALRFWGYRRYVFPADERDRDERGAADLPVEVAPQRLAA